MAAHASVDGGSISLRFTGKHLILTGQKGSHSFPARSGDGTAKYVPIAPGNYSIRTNEIHEMTETTDMSAKLGFMLKNWAGPDAANRAHENAWGRHRIPIHPHDRKLFIHGGSTLSSAGCIDLAGGMPDFVRALRAEEAEAGGAMEIPLRVEKP